MSAIEDNKKVLFDLAYTCDIYRYQILNYMSDHPDHDKDLVEYKLFYDGFSRGLEKAISVMQLENDYFRYCDLADKNNGYTNIASLPKLDNPFDVPDNLQ